MSFVQANHGSNDGSATASLAVAFSSNNTLGNLLIAITREPFGSGSSFSITDSAGNTGWTKAITFTYNSSDQAELYYCANCKAGANTVTLHPPSGNAFMRLVIGEYSNTTQTFDQSNHGTGTGTNTNSGSITPRSVNALVIGFVASSTDSLNLVNLPAGWSNRANADGNLFLCDITISTGGAQDMTAAYSSSTNWGSGIADFATIIVGKGIQVVILT